MTHSAPSRTHHARRHLLAVAITGVLACFGPAHAGAPDTGDDGEPVAATMHQLASDIQVLLPLIYRYDQPLSASERAQITGTLNDMEAHLGKVGAKVAPKADTYQISHRLLADQLNQARTELAAGRDQYALDVLRSATAVCASCHTQDDRAATWLAPASDEMADSFVAAEFLFLTRQYSRAFAAYETWLQQQDKLDYDQRTQTAFARLLLTSLQIQKSAKAVNDSLAGFVNQDNIDPMLKGDLTEWMAGMDDLQQRTDLSAHPDPAELKVLASEWLDGSDNEAPGAYLAESRRPHLVWLRGELYRALLNEQDRQMIPEWLYWLALSDRLLEYRFYYSLADMYLKQCMLEYSEHRLAPLCYQEYEHYVEFYYSGSSGTHIPDDVRRELKMLKATVGM